MRRSTSLAEPDAAPFEATPPAGVSTLARQHHRWLVAMLRLRYGRDLAEDLAQETFLRVAATPPPTPLRHPRTWLLRIAVNAARDLHRRRAVRPPLSEADGAVIAEHQPGHPTQHEALLLKQVILSLPPHLRDVMVLSRFGGLTYEEIAGRLQVSVKTVEWRMSKALAACAGRLRD